MLNFGHQPEPCFLYLCPPQILAYDPPPTISPAAPRRPSPRKPVRFARSAEPCPAPEGASGIPRRIRLLPGFCPSGTCLLRGRALPPGFVPRRGPAKPFFQGLVRQGIRPGTPTAIPPHPRPVPATALRNRVAESRTTPTP